MNNRCYNGRQRLVASNYGTKREQHTLIVEMYNGQTSRAAFPFGNNHICKIQFKLFDQIKISEGLWGMRHRGKLYRFGLWR